MHFFLQILLSLTALGLETSYFKMSKDVVFSDNLCCSVTAPVVSFI